jgi:hypothetical protein
MSIGVFEWTKRPRIDGNFAKTPSDMGCVVKNISVSNSVESLPRPASSSTPPLKPEWVRVPEAIRVSGLSRSSIYELIAAGKIKSFSNRQRGAVRGIRLISYDGLMAYLETAYQQNSGNQEAGQ